jgi:phosphatidylglycerophosphatase A
MKFIIKLFATGLGLGLMPFAPGTFGTLLGVGLYWLLWHLPIVHYIIFVVVFIAFSSWVADKAQDLYGTQDPGQIVIDEVAGFLVTMIGHPWGWKAVVAGFILFRIFDILKPFPIRRIDRTIHSGFGVVLDDVVAGVYANVCLVLVMRFV